MTPLFFVKCRSMMVCAVWIETDMAMDPWMKTRRGFMYSEVECHR